MSCLSWNCRGLGNTARVKELHELVKIVAPTVLCIQETQVHRAQVEGLKSTLGFDNAFAVSSSGRSGGLGLFWNNNTRVEILPYSQYHIDSIIFGNGGEPWRLTCVYGEAQVSERHKTWEMLKLSKLLPIYHGCVLVTSMKSSFSRNMKEYRSIAKARLLAFQRWLMSVDWWTSGSKDAGGLTRRR